MRKLIILLLFFQISAAFAVNGLSFVTDTISPPPDFPGTITGLQLVCEGTSSLYTADIPIGCTSSWYLDGVLQSSVSDSLEMFWTTNGIFIISLELTCDTSSLPPSYFEVEVGDLPVPPTSVTGDDDVCVQSTGYYSTEVMEGETCQWKVDGIVQPSDSAQLSYYWGLPGGHSIEVHTINDCGPSEGISINVYVNEWPVVDLGNDTTLLEGQSLELDAGNPGCDFLWSTGDTTQTIEVSTSGWYEVQVTNACGEVSDEIQVEVLVGIDPDSLPQEIAAFFLNDLLYIHGGCQKIERVQVADLKGRIRIDSKAKSSYSLTGNGIFFVVITTHNHQMFTIKLMKKD